MPAEKDDPIREVLAAIQAISEVCRDDKHAYLKDACAYAQEHHGTAEDAEERANLLYYPFKVASTLQSKSEQRLFVYAARGTRHLVSSPLVTSETPFAPPTISRTERKLGLFSTKDVSTPNVSMQQLDAESVSGESSLVEMIISTIELRTTILRGDHGFAPHTAAEDSVFTENLNCVATLMTESRFGLEGKRLLHCFQIGIVCCAELRAFASKSDPAVRDVLPRVISSILGRGKSYDLRNGVVDAIVMDEPEKNLTLDSLQARNCVALLDSISAASPDSRESGSREDYIQMQLIRQVRLFLLSHYFEEASALMCHWPALHQVFAKKTCPFLLSTLVSKDADSCSLALRALLAITKRHSGLLKSKAVYFVLGVILPLLESATVSTEKKEELLEFLQLVVALPNTLAEWFINFDCKVGAPSMVERLVGRLGSLKILRGDTSPGKRLTRKLYGVFAALAQSMSTLSELEEDPVEPSTPFSPLAHEAPADVDSSAVLRKMLEQKSKYTKAITLFNEARQYKAALQQAAEVKGFMGSSSPYDIAYFLMTCEDLNPTEVGNFLSHTDEDARTVLRAFIDLHEFGGLPIDEAVRTFLGTFRIGGEAETVGRTMEAFAAAYCDQNSGAMSKSAACVLAFSVVMLNTDAHSAHVKSKMTQEQYISNLRGTNDGKDFPTALLTGIYRRVTRREIRPHRQFPAYLLLSRTTSSPASSFGMAAPSDLRPCDNAAQLIAKDVQSETYVTEVRTPAVFGAILDISWNTLLPAFSFPLEESHEKDIVDLCLTGFSNCITTCCKQGRQSELKAFLFALSTFSHLTNLRAMEGKNVSAVSLLIDVAYRYGNELQDGWEVVCRCVSRIGRLAATELLSDRHQTDDNAALYPDIVTAAPRRAAADPSANQHRQPAAGGGGGLLRVPSKARVDVMDADAIHAVGKENMTVLFQHISKKAINSLFTDNAKMLRSESLLAMVKCVCTVVHSEIAAEPPRMLMFRYLMDVLEVNFTRRLAVWCKLWSMASQEIYSLLTTTKNRHQAVYAFKCLRRFTMAQLADDEMGNDASLVASHFELLQSLSAECNDVAVVESIAATVMQLASRKPGRLAPAWLAIIMTVRNCYERLPDRRTEMTVALHHLSTRHFPFLCARHEHVAALFHAWAAVARESAAVERYAVAHIRLLIASLSHMRDTRRIVRATNLQHRPPSFDGDGPRTAPGTLVPSLAALNDAVAFLDEDDKCEAPSFSLCVVGFSVLESLAAAFHARQSLAELAVDTLLHATAAFRTRIKVRMLCASAGDRQRLQQSKGQWDQLYSQCVLRLVDVYVSACVSPSVAASPTAALPPSLLPVPPALAAPASTATLVPFPSKQTPPAPPLSPERVSATALALLERLVVLLVKQELSNREGEGRDGGDPHGSATEEGSVENLDVDDGASTEGGAETVGEAASTAAATTVVEVHGEVIDVDVGETPSLHSDATSSTTRPSSPANPLGAAVDGPLPLLTPEAVGTRADEGAAPTLVSENSRDIPGPSTTVGSQNAADILDESRRDEVEEVNLNLVECLVTELCPSPHEKICSLGFLALRKLITARLECELSATHRAEMTELAKKLNASMQTYFARNVVGHCRQSALGTPARSLPPCECSPGSSPQTAERDVAAERGRLPTEGVLRACISYIDLIGLVIQQEVPVEGAEDVGVYEPLLDERTAADILCDFRNVYVEASKVLSEDYFSSLSGRDGMARAEGERILAMLITLECSISNVFIEMEVSREPTESQMASLNMSMETSGSRSAFLRAQPLQTQSTPDVPTTIISVLSPLNREEPPQTPLTLAGVRSPIQLQVEKFRSFVLNAFMEASREAKRLHDNRRLQQATSKTSMANQQQLLATRTVARSFLESLQRAPPRMVRRLLPKYRVELCELIKSCDEEIAPILSDIFLRYLSYL